MAEAAQPWDCEILDCPICFEKYRTPRTLPCLHTFCEECLDIYIKAQVKTESEFSCPVCRASIKLPESKAKVENRAASFPLNYMIVSMMEAGNKKLDSTSLCDSCRNGSKDSTAEFWCGDCSQALCKLCHSIHNTLTIGMNHETAPITEALTSQKFGKLQHVDESCPLHDGKTLEVYCSDHSKLCCVVCFATKHRECKNISDIDDISKETEGSVFSKFIGNMSGVTEKMDKIVAEKVENMTKVDSENETIVRQMESTVDLAKQHLDKLLSVFRDEVSSAHARSRSSLLTSMKEVQAFIKNVENAQKLLQTVINSSSQRQKFITYEKLRSQVLSHFENLKQILKDDQELSLALQIDSVLEQCIHKMASLGIVETKQKPSTTTGTVLSSVSELLQCSADIPVVDLLSASISLQKVVKKTDLGCSWLTGGTFLNNGNLLLVDTNKKCLFEFDKNWTLIKEHKVDGRPTTISNTDQDRVVVAFKESKEVRCYQLKPSLKLIFNISLQKPAWGVATCDNRIVVAGRDRVDILSQDGNVIKSITGNCYCDGYEYVAASQSPKLIYHGNRSTVVYRDLEGREVFTYNDPMLVAPRGFGLDRYNNLYVCGRTSGNLHQISSDRKRNRILINKFDSILNPYCIVVHPSENTLVITSNAESTAFEVYRFN